MRLFKPQFARLVEIGKKPCTVRPKPKRMPRPGDLISLRAWTGKPYRSQQRILREAVITAVKPIQIQEGMFNLHFSLDGKRMTEEERERFARLDGFQDSVEMGIFIGGQHDLPFSGIVIFWDAQPDSYASHPKIQTMAPVRAPATRNQ